MMGSSRIASVCCLLTTRWLRCMCICTHCTCILGSHVSHLSLFIYLPFLFLFAHLCCLQVSVDKEEDAAAAATAAAAASMMDPGMMNGGPALLTNTPYNVPGQMGGYGQDPSMGMGGVGGMGMGGGMPQMAGGMPQMGGMPGPGMMGPGGAGMGGF